MDSQQRYCSSLRYRAPWQENLKSLQTTEGLKMLQSLSCLGTHDIVLKSKADNPPGPRIPTDTIYILLFTGTDVTDNCMPRTEDRIQRLAASTGGLGIAIIFLLEDGTRTSGLMRITRLQESIVDMDMIIPILPLATLDELPTTLLTYKAEVGKSQGSPPLAAATQLLPYTTVDGKLQEHSVHVLTDITGSLKTLSECTRSVRGQEQLKQWLDGDDQRPVSGGIFDFWREEFIVD